MPKPTGKSRQREVCKTIGERMKNAREMACMSQQAAAKALGYENSSKLSKVETAKDVNSVPLWLVVEAAKVYEVSLDWLFGLSDDLDPDGDVFRSNRFFGTWIYESWEKARQRDLLVLKKLHGQIAAMDVTIQQMLLLCKESETALERFQVLNKRFDQMPGGATLVRDVSMAAAAARTAEYKLKRFRAECSMIAQDPERQMVLQI